MDVLIPALLILFIFLVVITILGHVIWLILASLFRELTGTAKPARAQTVSPQDPQKDFRRQPCPNCEVVPDQWTKFCGVCGARSLNKVQTEHLRELEVTLRQLDRLHQSGVLDEVTLRALKTEIENEREQILFPEGRPSAVKQASSFTPEVEVPSLRSVVTADTDEKAAPLRPSITEASESHARQQRVPPPGSWTTDSDKARAREPIPKPPRKPFAEIFAAFMEQSNIRWGEIIGGVLIIGCSTALVISLWAQISRVPVLKFFIFTTVTAALFGVGFYTEHRWKLPTTSRGILTIATLLVPLNFLAIAAVSTNSTPGFVVLSSEIVAPAIFLCLVHFAGRVITPAWPHLLAAGSLGSSVAQLLIRHFASPDISANLLVLLGAFPVVCYVGASGWMLKLALADGEIDEQEANAIFITLGTLTFAVLLPFGLLLHKSGSTRMSMMHLAPLVTVAATPLLAGGALIWHRVLRKEYVATRTAGASIAILGMGIALAGMILAWPNPASVVPAALFNFAVFTAIAVFLVEPRAHVLAAGCLALGYVIAFHVLAGHVPWENLRVLSLLQVTASAGTGQALALLFVAFVGVREWLARAGRTQSGFWYLVAACGVALVSLLFLGAFGIRLAGDPYFVSLVLALYATGAFWFAARERASGFAWAGSVLLFLAAAQACLSLFSMRFPWLASLLLFAAICTAMVLSFSRVVKPEVEHSLITPLYRSALIGSVAGAFFLIVQLVWNGCEPASLFATHALILAGVWLGLLIRDRSKILVNAFQAAIALGVVLTTKSYLQGFDWYGYQPNAWLHPWALQIQGIVLALICATWLVIRWRSRVTHEHAGEDERIWPAFAFDHLLAITLVGTFLALLIFGASSGISEELTNAARSPQVFNLAGFPHEKIFGIGSLILLLMLFAVMFGNLRARRRNIFALGVIAVLWAICPLIAGRFESQFATASVSRWAVAIFLLLLSSAYAFGKSLASKLERPHFALNRTVVLFIALVPLVLLTLSPIIDDVNYVPARGPQSGLFRAMGGVALYGVPLLLAAIALAIHAVRERSPAFAFAAGLLISFSVTTIHVVSVAQANGSMDRVLLVSSLQLNAIAAAVVALIWIQTRRWLSDLASPTGSERTLLSLQIAIAATLIASVVLPTGMHLIASPGRAGLGTNAAGSFIGWVGLLLAVSAIIVFHKSLQKSLSVTTFAFALVAAGMLAAFGAARFGVAKWAGLHALNATLILIAWLIFSAKDLQKLLSEKQVITRFWPRLGLTLSEDWEQQSLLWATLVGVVVVLIALRGPFADPLGGWWSIWALLITSALAASLHWVTLRRAYLYAAGILFNLSVSVWLLKYQNRPGGSLSAFVESNVVALSLTGILWLVLELRARRLRQTANPAAAFHNPAALFSLVAMIAVVAGHLYSKFYGFYQTSPPTLDWLAVFSVTALMLACLWDREAEYAVAGLYLLGLIKAATVLHHFDLTPRHLAWALAIAGAVHALGAAVIWRARNPLIALAGRLKIPARIDADVKELKWLNVFTCLLVATVVVLAFWIHLSFDEWPLRLSAASVVLIQTITFALLAEGSRREKWQRVAVAMFLGGAVFLGWACLTPGGSGTWLNRAVIVMALMFATVALFGAGLDKLIARNFGWTKAIRDCVPAMTVIGIAALAFVLCTEVYYQIEFGAVRVRLLALLTVAVTLAAAVVVCIFFAVSPRHDPLTLPDTRRGAYVYAAEVTLVLLFMHIRLTMPWLFHGFFQRYWPLVILAVAYAGVAISEFLRRKQVQVLAQPIERTGAFLPLLPVIGFWIAQSQVEYSTLLFIVGGLYGLLSILRRSFGFGLAAALAGNGGLWYLLHETSEYHFLQHPQLWLIPAAISVLIAAHLNRKDFTEAQMTGIRYLCLITIYVSSTADIFLNGIARSPWLPLALAGLSVAGVFAGMIFRIRAFLLLGSIFLLLAVATMINFAAVNFGWTWLWYVAGIVTGAAIIAMFAVFEKKRADVLRVVEELRDWKG